MVGYCDDCCVDIESFNTEAKTAEEAEEEAADIYKESEELRHEIERQKLSIKSLCKKVEELRAIPLSVSSSNNIRIGDF